MSEDDERQGVKWWTPILIVVVTYFVPHHFWISSGGRFWIQSVAIAFVITNDPFRLSVEVLVFHVEGLLFNFLFHVFALQWYRLYTGRASVRNVLVLGVLTVAFYWMISIGTLLAALWDPQWPYRSLTSLSIPFHVVIAWLFIRVYPPPKREEDTRPEWLEGQDSTSETEVSDLDDKL